MSGRLLGRLPRSRYIDSGTNMNPIRTLVLLVGCTAATSCSSANLPESQKLSPEKIAGIASHIESQYPKLSQEKRDEVLRTVVRSLDEMVFIEGGSFEMGDFGWKCDFDPAEVCTWPCGAPEDNLCNITRDSEDGPHRVGLASYHLAAKKTTLGDFRPLPVGAWKGTRAQRATASRRSAVPVRSWEYAARDRGKNILYPTNDGSLKLGKNFPYDEEMQQISSRVDAFPPNPLGLYLMSGGATEYVNDWYSDSYYAESANQVDPKGPETGEEKVARGTDMVDTPWLAANTVIRRNQALVLDKHYLTRSFRCALNTGEMM